MARHGLKPGAIIGHSDIAPQRKVDPGPLFRKRLAEEGSVPGRMPARWRRRRRTTPRRAAGDRLVPEALAAQGYRVPRHGHLDDETRNVIAAFQMKYRPTRFDGEPDAETAAMLQVLVARASR